MTNDFPKAMKNAPPSRASPDLVVNGTAIPANSRTGRNIRVLDTPWPEYHRQEDR